MQTYQKATTPAKEISTFLDYVIVQQGNKVSLNKPKGKAWEIHLGNFNNVDAAKKIALAHFIISHPHKFTIEIYYSIKNGSGFDYYQFETLLKELYLDLPLGVSESTDRKLAFNGDTIKFSLL